MTTRDIVISKHSSLTRGLLTSPVVKTGFLQNYAWGGRFDRVSCEGQQWVGAIRCSANATPNVQPKGSHGARGSYAGKLMLSLDMSALKSGYVWHRASGNKPSGEDYLLRCDTVLMWSHCFWTFDTYSRRCAEHTKFLNSSQPVNAKNLTVVKKIFGVIFLK